MPPKSCLNLRPPSSSSERHDFQTCSTPNVSIVSKDVSGTTLCQVRVASPFLSELGTSHQHKQLGSPSQAPSGAEMPAKAKTDHGNSECKRKEPGNQIQPHETCVNMPHNRTKAQLPTPSPQEAIQSSLNLRGTLHKAAKHDMLQYKTG